MKKSARVRLTVAAAVALAARADAQDPCEAASFNRKACKIAIRERGFCSGGAWVSAPYPESYSYYNDLYRLFRHQGGLPVPAPMESCGQYFGAGAMRGGFGAFAAIHAGGGHSGG
jgi:hypothetical protein